VPDQALEFPENLIHAKRSRRTGSFLDNDFFGAGRILAKLARTNSVERCLI
jgi:hypothetical protein